MDILRDSMKELLQMILDFFEEEQKQVDEGILELEYILLANDVQEDDPNTQYSPRPVMDQFSRLRHLKLAPEVIQNSRTLQGIWTTQRLERVRKNDKKWEKVMKLTTYHEFIAVMESHGSKIRVKVIVKQIVVRDTS